MKTEVYEPQKYVKMGIRVWPFMFRELWEARELVWRLFMRSFSARYRLSLLGYVWVLITPAVAIGTFLFLKKAGVVAIGPTAAPYVVFAFAGLCVYQLFSSGVVAGCTALTEAGDMVARVSFPREVLVVAAVGGAVFEFLVKAVFLLIVCAVTGFMPAAGAVLSLVAVIPVVFLVLGCAFFLSLANAVIRDVAQIAALGLTFLMFLTPVLYPVPRAGLVLFHLNPLTALVDGPRDLFIYGSLRDPQGFVLSAVFSIWVFFVGWRIFHLVETKIPERL